MFTGLLFPGHSVLAIYHTPSSAEPKIYNDDDDIIIIIIIIVIVDLY